MKRILCMICGIMLFCTCFITASANEYSDNVYIYNDLQLDIPDWDSDTYPFAVITRNTYDEKYLCVYYVTGSIKFQNDKLYIANGGTFIYSKTADNGSTWTTNAPKTIDEFTAFSDAPVSYILWSSADISYKNSGDIAFTGSQPVLPEIEEDIQQLDLIKQNNELLAHIYTALLFCIGTCCAILVCYLLYQFIRKFY